MPEFYRGQAFVHWTFTTENGATGWLAPDFHRFCQYVLVHANSRYNLATPVHVLMPDHVHLLWIGIADDSGDQRVAAEFLRKYMTAHLSPARWQHQAFDHVLREQEREAGAVQSVAQYILENPVRARLVQSWRSYPYVGCAVAGYPALDVKSEDSWGLFWRIYLRQRRTDRGAQPATRSRS